MASLTQFIVIVGIYKYMIAVPVSVVLKLILDCAAIQQQ